MTSDALPANATLSRGETYAKYLVEYYYDGSFWIVDIFATSFADAEARVKQLQYAKVSGEIYAEIPARLGSLARFWVWLRG